MYVNTLKMYLWRVYTSINFMNFFNAYTSKQNKKHMRTVPELEELCDIVWQYH